MDQLSKHWFQTQPCFFAHFLYLVLTLHGRVVRWCFKELRSWVQTPHLVGSVQSLTSQLLFCSAIIYLSIVPAGSHRFCEVRENSVSFFWATGVGHVHLLAFANTTKPLRRCNGLVVLANANKSAVLRVHSWPGEHLFWLYPIYPAHPPPCPNRLRSA
jgi:hypothetical protein